MILHINPQGCIRAIYQDDFSWKALGIPQIQRASRVEPDADGFWFADLSLSGGPKLGPFPRRADALAAEVHWLEEHRL
jgi:hypothetical protein